MTAGATIRTPASDGRHRLLAAGALRGRWHLTYDRRPMKTSAPQEAAPGLIDDKIAQLGDWRGKTLATLRAIILGADPQIIEEWKWGTPVWSRGGIVCTGETYKKAVKMTFAKGAALADPKKLFNSSLEGNTRRAIDVGEGETIDAAALKALVQSAVALNLAGKGGGKKVVATETTAARSKPAGKTASRPTSKPAGKATRKPAGKAPGKAPAKAKAATKAKARGARAR
jgi:hypothetical protein